MEECFGSKMNSIDAWINPMGSSNLAVYIRIPCSQICLYKISYIYIILIHTISILLCISRHPSGEMPLARTQRAKRPFRGMQQGMQQ